MMNWYYMVAAAGVLIIFLLYKEWNAKNKRYLYGRLIVSMLAVASLLLLAYPAIQKSNSSAVKKIILLTKGFNRDSLDAFLHQTNTTIPVFAAEPVSWRTNTGNTFQLVTDWRAFALQHTTDTMHVFGNGFSSEILSLINPHSIIFHAGVPTPAISHAYWKQNLLAGEPLIVQGHVDNNTTQRVKIVLQAFGVARDTFSMDAIANQDFSLHTVPVHLGRAVYSLLVIAGKDTLYKEPIPVNVQQVLPLQLLILSSSPDFENTFLKNYLSQQGYQVSVFTTITINKSAKQFLNTAQQPASALTLSYLEKFDLLVADAAALQKISARELSAIRTTIKEKGTGLVIKLDAEKSDLFYTRFFPVKIMPHDKPATLQLRGAGTDPNQYKIKTTDLLSIGHLPGTQIILQDAQLAVYAAATVYGNGKIVATTLQNTFSIALAGDKTSYQQLWWLLVNTAAKKNYPEETWQNSLFPAVNDPVSLQVETNDSLVSTAFTPTATVPLTKDALLPFQWKGLYWPPKAGWQALPQLSTQTGDWYVYKQGDWQQLTTQERLVETRKYANLHPASTAQSAYALEKHFTVNRPLLLLVIFLSCCIFLWMEQKTG